jgi:DNA mismatch repair protein MutS
LTSSADPVDTDADPESDGASLRNRAPALAESAGFDSEAESSPAEARAVPESRAFAASAPLTPMMKQYLDTKTKVEGALLLFRMGDFYELFFEDAKEAARVLGLTLTTRDKGENPVPMAGFPWHALDTQLRKLLEAGIRVAICDQVEDPKLAQGLVKREVTRIISPGTLTDENLLDPRRSNYLAALAPGKGRGSDEVGLAWLDLSTGSLTAGVIPATELPAELGRLEPAECLLSEDLRPDERWFAVSRPGTLTARPSGEFHPDNAAALLMRHLGVATFQGYGFEEDRSPALAAAGAILAYLIETQKADLRHIGRIIPYDRRKALILDPMTRRSLELTRTIRDNRREGSLLDSIDRTVTSAGARLLAEWVQQPLVEIPAIVARQQAVGEWKDDSLARQELRELLRKACDLERLVGRVSTGRTHPRDLAALRDTLRILPSLKARLTARNAPFNDEIEREVTLFGELRERLDQSLVEAPPLPLKEGGIIREGFLADLDELRSIARGGKEWIAEYQRSEAERTGIANLKVGFNKVFGFYLEVTNSFRDRVPPEWSRRQTVKNAERYITPPLKEYEQKVLTAEDRARELEYDLFCKLRDEVAVHVPALQTLARAIARLDVALGLAELAASNRYVRPALNDDGETRIIAGRHPVLDVTLAPGRFVPNDTLLDHEAGRVVLITGPNMAGKSTYIRQTALLHVLAQLGSFLPAESAVIGIADRIFARVGASDELQRGQSTFMVEMTETANILNNATRRSLVILDEIGRGTSTYDGVSLAWAITEHLLDQVGCRALFATHYHELIELERTRPGLRNCSVAVREWKDEIIFLYQIAAGGSDRSYGIHVARLAGLPNPVLRRAQEILHRLEKDPFGQPSSLAGDMGMSPHSDAGPSGSEPTAAGSRSPRIGSDPHAGSSMPIAPGVAALGGGDPASSSAASGMPRKHRRAWHQLSLFPQATAHPVLDDLRMTDPTRLGEAELRKLLSDWRHRLLADD